MKSYSIFLWLILYVLIPRMSSSAERPELDVGVPPPSVGTFYDPATIVPPGLKRIGPKEHRDLFRFEKDDDKMVQIPGGLFWMGSDSGFPDERPRRKVLVDSFFIDKYEVTNRQFFAAGMKPAKSYGSRFESPRLPVVGVTWHQSEVYCKKMGKRLPAEAEWEKAAKGFGSQKFPWGNDWNPGFANDSSLGPMPIGSFDKGKSPFGVHDMAGNVWEWVSDVYDRKKEEAGHNSPRVMRGGAWGFHALYLRSSYRRMELPEFQGRRVGFRCAKDAP